jgi:hypothetical protein
MFKEFEDNKLFAKSEKEHKKVKKVRKDRNLIQNESNPNNPIKIQDEDDEWFDEMFKEFEEKEAITKSEKYYKK